MFKSQFLNQLASWVLIAIVTIWVLSGLWNWVMPALGVGTLTFWQFAGLFLIVRGLTTDLVSFKSPKPKTEETH